MRCITTNLSGLKEPQGVSFNITFTRGSESVLLCHGVVLQFEEGRHAAGGRGRG